MRTAVLAAILLSGRAAHADATVEVMLNQQGMELAEDLGLSVPELIAHAESRIDELYRLSRLEDLLRAFADTGAFAQRGLGVDYDIDLGDVVLGVAAAGVHGDIQIGTTSWFGGAFYNFAIMAGANLGRWDLDRVSVFANGYYQTTEIRGLEGHLLTLGAHAQYQLVPASAPARARWTGVAVTSGIEYSRWSVGTSSTLTSHFTAQGPAERATVQMDSTGTLDVLATSWTVPVEVTTGARLLGVLAPYGGVGASLTSGTSRISAQLNSNLSINSDNLPVGTAVISGSGESEPSVASAYALAGLAVHTRHARVYAQGSLAPGELLVAFGFRIAL